MGNHLYLSAVARILIVEDDKYTREVMQAVLEMEGYAVAAAQHGEDALRLSARGTLVPGTEPGYR